jgi:hypothetical protein
MVIDVPPLPSPHKGDVISGVENVDENDRSAPESGGVELQS